MEKGPAEKPGYFVGIPITTKKNPQPDAYTHVTIALRMDCEGEVLQRMIDAMMELPLPLVLVISPELVLFGHKKDIPVHLVSFPDYAIQNQLADFYARFYKQTPGHTPHPQLVAHVSVDTPERESVVKSILEDGDHGVYIAKHIELKRVGGKEVLFAVGNK